MSERIFEIRAPATAPFGLVGWIFVGALLGGLPLLSAVIVIATMGAEPPGTAAMVSLVCLVPIAILHTLHRLFTRFRLAILSDGAVEFVEPFKTTRVPGESVATANWRSSFVAHANTRVNWLILSDGKGAQLLAISPMAFGQDALNDFVTRLQQANPGLSIADS